MRMAPTEVRAIRKERTSGPRQRLCAAGDSACTGYSEFRVISLDGLASFYRDTVETVNRSTSDYCTVSIVSSTAMLGDLDLGQF